MSGVGMSTRQASFPDSISYTGPRFSQRVHGARIGSGRNDGTTAVDTEPAGVCAERRIREPGREPRHTGNADHDSLCLELSRACARAAAEFESTERRANEVRAM